MDFLQVIEKRKTFRKYSDRPVDRDILEAIVRVAQTAPSSRNSKSTAFMIIEDRDTIDALSQMRDYGAAFMKDCPMAIMVAGDESVTDLWVDNCSISATILQLAVTDAGLGSCWVHINGRPKLKAEPEGKSAEEYLRELTYKGLESRISRGHIIFDTHNEIIFEFSVLSQECDFLKELISAVGECEASVEKISFVPIKYDSNLFRYILSLRLPSHNFLIFRAFLALTYHSYTPIGAYTDTNIKEN